MINVVYGENVQSICRVSGAAAETVVHIAMKQFHIQNAQN